MIVRFTMIIASMLIALMTVDARADSCNEDKAKKRFVSAENMVRRAEELPKDEISDKINKLKTARNELIGITEAEESKCSWVAVRLASGERIGKISIAGLKKQINRLENNKNVLPGCWCAHLHYAIASVLELERGKSRDSILATIARKMVRHDKFRCAKDLIQSGLFHDDKKSKFLHRDIVRAQVGSGLKKETCCCQP